MTSDTVIAARAASVSGTSRGAERARREGAERLGRLTERLESIATELTTTTKTKSERTVLRARFAEVQVRVNRLDGIVSGEGAETAGAGRLARAETAPDTVTLGGDTAATATGANGAPAAGASAPTDAAPSDTTPSAPNPAPRAQPAPQTERAPQAEATPQVDIIA